MTKEIIVDGIDDVELENTPIDSLETEEINLMFLAIDVSASMQQYIDAMKNELTSFKDSIINSKESDKILVSRTDFSEFIKTRGYKPITAFDTDYTVNTNTRLYDVIIEGSEKLTTYMNYLRQQGMRVKAVFAVFSDGADTASKRQVFEAAKAIEALNNLEIVTAFVTFGNDALNVARDDLRFRNILEVGRDEHELRKAFNQLSKSMISASKSVLPKTDDFFEV